MPAAKTVDAYVQSLPKPQAKIVSRLRAIMQKAAPEAKESIKWSQPVYETNGPFAYIKAYKKAYKGYVNLGFWRGVDIADPKGLLQGSGKKMRHLSLTEAGEINAAALEAMVRGAVKLNATKGNPTKRQTV